MSVLVSVIMPTYNCAEYIERSIKSVFAQTFGDFEIVIVDDCSTDNTEEILQPYLNSNHCIRYIKFEKNYGTAVARTEAIKVATGKYCAFLDSDDLWDNTKLAKQISFMEDNHATFSCTGYRFIDSSGQKMNKALSPPRLIDYSKCIRLGNPIGNLTVMYDQEKLGKVVVPSLKKRNDFALWLQLLRKTKYCFGMQDVLASYTVGRHNSLINSNKLSNIKYNWDLYYKVEKLGVLKSAFNILSWGFVKSTKIGLNIHSD